MARLIATITDEGCLDLPLKDMGTWQRTRSILQGKVVILGRRTFDKGWVEGAERTFVLTHRLSQGSTVTHRGVSYVSGLPEVLAAIRMYPESRVWVAGGARTFEKALSQPYWLTHIDLTVLSAESPRDPALPRFPLEALRSFELVRETVGSNPNIKHKIYQCSRKKRTPRSR